jgi:hypothetical protein
MDTSKGHWISPEGAAVYLCDAYKKIGVNIPYEKMLRLIIQKCDTGELDCVTIPHHMYDKAEMN